MDESNNQLGATGGAVSTGNPQDIGNQNISGTQSNLQSPGVGVQNSTNLRLTDESGRPLNISSTNSTTASVKPTTNKSHGSAVIGISIIIIAFVFLVTWLTTRKTTP